MGIKAIGKSEHPGSVYRNTAVWYSALFLAAAVFVFLPFALTKRSFVYKVDGASQYIVYLRYMGAWLRNSVKNLLHGQFVPLMYDFSIGMGDDINAIVRFHPLDFLSVFVPGRYTEYLYEAILLLRYYLSGLSFCVFALSWNDPARAGSGRLPFRIVPVNVLTGALVYVFSGYMLMRVMNHPTYAAPFILLPMLLLGIERTAEGKGTVLFPAAVALSFISNYYFMYISSIALACYVLLRLPALLSVHVKGERLKNAILLFGKLALLYLLGLGMSLITLLPTLLRYFSSYRTHQTSAAKNLLYYADIRRYGAWLLNLIAPYVSSGNGTNLNFAVTVFPLILILFFCCARKLRVLKGTLLLELFCLLVPAAGYVLAAFNNENNRWMFLIALSLGMAAALCTDYLAEMSGREQILLAAAGIAYAAAAAAGRMVNGGWYYPAAALMLLISLAVLIVLVRRGAGVKAVRGALLVLTFLSVVLNAWMTYLPAFGNLAVRCKLQGKAFSWYTSSPMRAAGQISDDSFYRVELSGVDNGRENAGIYYGTNGVSMYNSILNADMICEMMAEDNAGLDAVTHMQDLDTRTVAEALAGVRYYATKREGMVPFGFSPEPVLRLEKTVVYRNAYALPFGYTYDRVIPEDIRSGLDAEQQEYVLLSSASVKEEDLSSMGGLEVLSGAPEETGSLTVPLILPETGTDVERTAEGYRIPDKKGSITIPCEQKSGYTAMLRLKGFSSDRELSKVVIKCGRMKKRITLRSPEQAYTIGREDYLIDLMEAGDMSGEGQQEIVISFRNSGLFRLEGAEIVYLPADPIAIAVEERSREALADAVFLPNRITGSVTLTGEKLMVFSLLFQKGWTLLVDGIQTPLVRANGCWTGAVIGPGEHRIELSYVTPGLRAGALISALSLIAWILLAALSGKRRRDRRGDRS